MDKDLPSSCPVETPFGRVSHLSLLITPGGLEKVFFTAPYKVLHPFRQQGFWQVMAAKASAGLMAGDRQEVRVELAAGARAEILSQSYEKIHAMEEGQACRRGELKVGRDAVLFYAPLPVLPFADSAFESIFRVDLEDGTSRLFYADIIACGRKARGERFKYRLYASRLRVYQSGHLLYADNIHFMPEEEGLGGLTQYEGYTHLGSYLLMNFSISKEELFFQLGKLPFFSEILAGITTVVGGGICVKVLANGSEPLIELQNKLKDMLREKALSFLVSD